MQAAPPRAALRLLGVARSIPLAPLRGLFPVMYVGFWVDALSGLALLSANATGTSATASVDAPPPARKLALASLEYDWIWPICEMLHFVGMALLIGTVGWLDIRILGFGKQVPIASLERLLPIVVLGFCLNVIMYNDTLLYALGM